MAALLWGKVYYQDTFTGIIRQEPGGGSSFIYDPSYLENNHRAIAHRLPLQSEPHEYQTELPPFFDNLVAEGWLEQAQSRVLGKRHVSRFELLLAFGYDCAGAVSVIDPNPEKLTDALLDLDDPKEVALLTNRASLSGVQPKLTIIEKDYHFYPTKSNQLSTHIAKFPSAHHLDLVANEYLTMQAFKELLPEEEMAELQIGKVAGFEEDVLIIKRFDRMQGSRIHFEEFNQLLDRPANSKYIGAYKDMADFISTTAGCLPTEIYRLYLRILTGILLGNSDMHLKNFAMLYTPSGLRLAPVYDQLAALLYGYKQSALEIDNHQNLILTKLEAADLIALGHEFGLNDQSILMAVQTLEQRFTRAKETVMQAEFGSTELKQKLAEIMDKIWNNTFVSIGQQLSQRR